MAYTSNLGRVADAMTRARRDGLEAAAAVLVTAVKRGLRGGYTSGKYVTGNVVASVTASEPMVTPSLGEVRVGTNVKYALYWELGFVPARGVFSPGVGRNAAGPIMMRRKEVWGPAMRDTAERQRAAYLRAFNRSFGTAGARRSVDLTTFREEALPDNIILGDS